MTIKKIGVSILLLTSGIYCSGKDSTASALVSFGKKECKYKCFLMKREWLGYPGRNGIEANREIITDSLNIDNNWFIRTNSHNEAEFKSITFEILDTLSSKMDMKYPGLKIYLVAMDNIAETHDTIIVDDLPAAVIMKIDNKYAISFNIENIVARLGFMPALINGINLNSKEKVLQYIDFLTRLEGWGHSFGPIARHRINKPEDIWVYPQVIQHKYSWPGKGYRTEGIKPFNKEMMVEEVDKRMDSTLVKPERFYSYKNTIDALGNKISPAVVDIKKDKITVSTFISTTSGGNIEYWNIELKKDGTVFKLYRKTILKDAGYDSWDQIPPQDNIKN
ncbi:MAG TPA: hypothetical protein VHO43_19655 [Ignavibacteriales bacterium]|nr:hypothetical protein [Ignavibacteriales bacterium]